MAHHTDKSVWGLRGPGVVKGKGYVPAKVAVQANGSPTRSRGSPVGTGQPDSPDGRFDSGREHARGGVPDSTPPKCLNRNARLAQKERAPRTRGESWFESRTAREGTVPAPGTDQRPPHRADWSSVSDWWVALFGSAVPGRSPFGGPPIPARVDVPTVKLRRSRSEVVQIHQGRFVRRKAQ